MNCFKKLKTYYSPEEVGLEERIELLRRFGSICKELKIYRKYRKNVHWGMKEERTKKLSALLDQLDTLIREWQGELPNLGNFFRREDIDWLLAQAAMNVSCSEPDQGKKIIEFVARSGYRDEPDLDKYGKPSPRRTTPVHHVAKPDGYIMRDLMQLFVIYNRHDVNYTDESGLSHFHVACRVGCEELVKKFLELGQDPNFLWKKTGDSPLLLALMGCGSSRTAELLMRKGANLNWANKKEITPLHYICGMSADPYDLMEMFFDMNDELNQLLKIDARDRLGNTPLHWAVGKHKNATKSLLRRGANPNSANNAGSTPLHLMSQRVWSVDFVEMFFKINDELNKQVQVDVRDMLGRTPLQLAFCHANKKAAEILLRRGANPNLADEDGLTTLHLICTRDDENDLVEFFFKINDELNQVIQVDAEDKSGRTPLQLAVANLMMNDVDVLLDRGADLSSFIFPNESDFDEGFKWIKTRIAHKSMLASGLMTVVESLEKRGYELDRCEALTIMKLFSKYGLFRKSMDLGKCWYDEEEFATEAKEAMVNSSLSLYDLIQLRPKEAAKLLAYADYYKFLHAVKLWRFDKIHFKAYETHLCEKILREFLWRWALDPFMELTHYRLPHLPCEMIMDNLENEDLYYICVAASG